MVTYKAYVVDAYSVANPRRCRVSVDRYEIRLYGGERLGDSPYLRPRTSERNPITLAGSMSGRGRPDWMVRFCKLINGMGIDAADDRLDIGQTRWQLGPWVICIPRGRRGISIKYLPYGDERDAAQFGRCANEELRRLILERAGESAVSQALGANLVQADDYGRLYDTIIGRQVRVVCPSTGRVYWLGVPYDMASAHDAVAATFGLSARKYAPSLEA